MSEAGEFLKQPGAKALVGLTNSQFAYWASQVTEASQVKPADGDLMDFWFILSNLALQGDDDFRVPKKAMLTTIPGLKEEAVRKYILKVERAGLAETVRHLGVSYLTLRPDGQVPLAKTLSRWVDEFGRIQRDYF